jgi:hypothetical protein
MLLVLLFVVLFACGFLRGLFLMVLMRAFVVCFGGGIVSGLLVLLFSVLRCVALCGCLFGWCLFWIVDVVVVACVLFVSCCVCRIIIGVDFVCAWLIGLLFACGFLRGLLLIVSVTVVVVCVDVIMCGAEVVVCVGGGLLCAFEMYPVLGCVCTKDGGMVALNAFVTYVACVGLCACLACVFSVACRAFV